MKNNQAVFVKLAPGDIHHYSPDGKYIGCTIKGCVYPNGITLTPAGDLVVATHASGKIDNQKMTRFGKTEEKKPAKNPAGIEQYKENSKSIPLSMHCEVSIYIWFAVTLCVCLLAS